MLRVATASTLSPRRALLVFAGAVLVAAGCSEDAPTPAPLPSPAAPGAGGSVATSSTGGGSTTTTSSGAGGASTGGGGGAGGAPVDPCVGRPPLALTSAFDVIYSNSNPTPMTFTGTTSWIDAFQMEFPRDSGTAKRIRIDRDHYAVIEIDTFDVEETFGVLVTENPQITPNTGSKLVSISPCPGDFVAPLGDPDCRKRLGIASNLNWSFDDEFNSCQLERDRTYYLNIVYTADEEPPITWECTLTPGADDCAMLFVPTSG